MNHEEFQTLIEAIVARAEGWQTLLIASWSCLLEDQKLLLKVITQ